MLAWRGLLEVDREQQRIAGGSIIKLIMSAAQRELRSGFMSWLAHYEAGRLRDRQKQQVVGLLTSTGLRSRRFMLSSRPRPTAATSGGTLRRTLWWTKLAPCRATTRSNPRPSGTSCRGCWRSRRRFKHRRRCQARARHAACGYIAPRCVSPTGTCTALPPKPNDAPRAKATVLWTLAGG